MSEEDALHVMRTVVHVVRAVDKALQPDGLNLIQANRRAAFQSVYHFHMYFIPRWWDDGMAPLWRHAPGDPELIQKTGQRLETA